MANVQRAVSVYCVQLARLHRRLIFEERELRRGCKQRQRRGVPRCPEPQEVLNAPYCFVLSTGRCGTSLITKILALSPRLAVEHQPAPGLEYVSSWIHRDPPSKQSLKVAIVAARFDIFLRSFLRGRMYVETNNRVTLFAPALAELLPNAKFIHLIRHPADFVRSGMRRGYYQDGNVQHQRLHPVDQASWHQMTRVEKIAWEWNEINAAIAAFEEECAPGRLLTIKSEDLFRDVDLMPKLFAFLGVPPPYRGASASAKYAKLLKRPVNKQKRGAFPKYVNWTEEDKASLRTYATLASRYGYKC